MTETLRKKSKIPMFFWQIVAEIFGSVVGVLFFIEILSGIFGIYNDGLFIAMALMCFILVPAVFAFSIAIKKAMLLFIPVVIFPLFIVIFYFDSYPESILFFCTALAFISVFGAVAGILIRLFRFGKGKKKNVIVTIGVLVLLTPVLFIGYVFSGFRFYSIPVNIKVKNYVAKTYSEFDVTVGRTWYDWYDGTYVTKVFDKNDKDIYFEIWYYDREITDRYTYGEFWELKFKKMLSPLLEEEFKDELIAFRVSVSGIEIGQQFSKDAPVKKTAYISVTPEDTEPSFMAEMMMKYYEFIEQNGFAFKSYSFYFRRIDGRNGIKIEVRADYFNDDLTELIEEMRGLVNERGSYYDHDRGLWYEDFAAR